MSSTQVKGDGASKRKVITRSTIEVVHGSAQVTLYWGSGPLPVGAEALGLVRRDGETGALLRMSTGVYVQGNAGAIRTLPQRDVRAALAEGK